MFSGSMVALATPMYADGGLDWDSLHNLVEWHIEQGTRALVAVGTTGESATLDVNEHLEVIRRVVDQVAGRIAVIAGTGANSTTEAIELTETAAKCGADACLLVTPYYNKPTQEGLFQHYKTVARAVSIPQILYNVPGRTAVDMLPETVQRLAAIGNIVGIKEATGDMERARTLKEMLPEDFAIYSGDDATALDLILLGGHGSISVTANVAPAAVAQVCEAALNGDAETARAIDQRIEILHRMLFLEANPIPVKWALREMGRIDGGIRLPLTNLSAEHHAAVREALRSAGVL
ncbi:4-hydroxy-tetrahydrodipicolinate synthase [Microbulbifer halophilus]|uniref:4-hydroxy-tetrahydrodipicolinate synthase n=1 Tax=Microbulbifer halophilus TaxID=453963 RepID=A0ABW5E962_9GAMM|nr:4-hydroxy-tetrahydrodipicolinate synthase [Microbulbifer halophilus]MCW8125028.1 4-hydroxy-tetrahydrodipicolinate synthase [Microbulbifer halophilus]